MVTITILGGGREMRYSVCNGATGSSPNFLPAAGCQCYYLSKSKPGVKRHLAEAIP